MSDRESRLYELASTLVEDVPRCGRGGDVLRIAQVEIGAAAGGVHGDAPVGQAINLRFQKPMQPVKAARIASAAIHRCSGAFGYLLQLRRFFHQLLPCDR